MPSSGAVIHMLCSEELRRSGHRPPPAGPDRKRTLEGFLHSIWPWGRDATSGTPGGETASVAGPGDQGAADDPR